MCFLPKSATYLFRFIVFYMNSFFLVILHDLVVSQAWTAMALLRRRPFGEGVDTHLGGESRF